MFFFDEGESFALVIGDDVFDPVNVDVQAGQLVVTRGQHKSLVVYLKFDEFTFPLCGLNGEVRTLTDYFNEKRDPVFLRTFFFGCTQYILSE